MRFYDNDIEPGTCECGVSVEDCNGECYEHSLAQLADPVTGETTLPVWVIDNMDLTALAASRRWGVWRA